MCRNVSLGLWHNEIVHVCFHSTPSPWFLILKNKNNLLIAIHLYQTFCWFCCFLLLSLFLLLIFSYFTTYFLCFFLTYLKFMFCWCTFILWDSLIFHVSSLSLLIFSFFKIPWFLLNFEIGSLVSLTSWFTLENLVDFAVYMVHLSSVCSLPYVTPTSCCSFLITSFGTLPGFLCCYVFDIFCICIIFVCCSNFGLFKYFLKTLAWITISSCLFFYWFFTFNKFF